VAENVEKIGELTAKLKSLMEGLSISAGSIKGIVDLKLFEGLNLLLEGIEAEMDDKVDGNKIKLLLSLS